MFGKMGLHLIDYPNGKFGFVGSIPTSLCNSVPASTSDVMGGRAFRDDSGSLMTWRTPVFASASEARAFAASRGETVCNAPGCTCSKYR